MPLLSIHNRNLGSGGMCHKAVPGSQGERQACRQMGALFLLHHPVLTLKSNETACKVSSGESETEPAQLDLRLVWAPAAVLGISRACEQHHWLGDAPVFVTKLLLRLGLGFLATSGKASIRFVGFWDRSCILQLFLNHAGTEERSVCSYWSSHYYPCLWTGGKCIHRLAALLCPRCLHNQIFPPEKGISHRRKQVCQMYRKEHD